MCEVVSDEVEVVWDFWDVMFFLDFQQFFQSILLIWGSSLYLIFYTAVIYPRIIARLSSAIFLFSSLHLTTSSGDISVLRRQYNLLSRGANKLRTILLNIDTGLPALILLTAGVCTSVL